jgi:hypothetical protein
MEQNYGMTYDRIHSLVMQMPWSEKEQLRRALNEMCDEKDERLRPYTVEELKEFVSEGEEDYRAGRYCTAEEGWKRLEEKFPWLKD